MNKECLFVNRGKYVPIRVAADCMTIFSFLRAEEHQGEVLFFRSGYIPLEFHCQTFASQGLILVGRLVGR